MFLNYTLILYQNLKILIYKHLIINLIEVILMLECSILLIFFFKRN